MKFLNSNINLDLPREKKVFIPTPGVHVLENNFLVHEPMRQYRFLMSFTTINGVCQWYVRDFNIIIDNGYMDVNLGPYNMPIPTRSSNEISFSLFSPINENSQIFFTEWVKAFSESVTSRMGYAQNYKRNLIIEKLDPVGISVETYICNGVQIKSIEFENLDMSNDSLENLNCVFTMDSFTIE